ncbi:hypothetical protein J2793_006424 [Paraburkholderia caledonica]|uniref:Uncharacterized protein n=1 Tax=Paraburkholderia caledonica TaxID=134536 RepID=A0AB73ILY2_9BURK|nr:hypothetical protein [Paraburkholderia caledonica]
MWSGKRIKLHAPSLTRNCGIDEQTRWDGGECEGIGLARRWKYQRGRCAKSAVVRAFPVWQSIVRRGLGDGAIQAS